MNILDNIGQAQMNAVTEQRAIPEFGPGDTLKINVKVVEGSRERVQAFEGVCIGRSNRGINSSFTVRKISYGEGVERIFPLYSQKFRQLKWSDEVMYAAQSCIICVVAPVKLPVLPRRQSELRRVLPNSKITFDFAFLKVFV